MTSTGTAATQSAPVADLEARVSPSWWDEIFDELYLMTDGDVVEDERLTREEIDQFLDLMPLRQDARILDICCGQGRHVLELARRGFTNVVGVDRSGFLLDQARARGRAAKLSATFHEADSRAIPLAAASSDAVLMLGNSFGYFAAPSDDEAVLREVHRLLRPDGTFLLDITNGEFLKQHFEPRSWEWIAQDMFTCRERTLSAAGDQLVTREMTTHVARGVIADRFYAERLYSEDDMRAAFARTGFAEICPPTKLVAGSTRNQDLGMMAQRLIFVARKV